MARTDVLENLIYRAGTGLEAEDRLLIGAGRVRGENGGLLRLVNERYYQFIVWRSVLSTWRATVEESRHDLHLADANGLAAIVEMKGWWSPNGEKELPGIGRDLAKLDSCATPVALLMVFSANPRGTVDEQKRCFEQEVFKGRIVPRSEIYSFPTFGQEGNEVDFWVAAWEIKSAAP